MDETNKRADEDLSRLRIERAGDDTGGGRWVWVVGIAFVVIVAAGFWWWRAGHAEVQVRTAEVREKGAAGPGAVLNASGYVTARRRATVSSKTTGKVVEIRVEEGTAVREGQELARLDDRVTRSLLALDAAQLVASRRAAAETEVRLRLAETTLDRTRRLVASGVSGKADLDAALAERDALDARLALAREQVDVAERQVGVRRQELDDLVVRAPFSGVAISKDAQPGEMVSPISAGGGFTRTGICTVVDMSSLEIEVDVNESYIQRVRPAQRVEATLDAYPDWRIPCSVITTIPAADRQKATVRVRVAFDTLDPRILPDMGVKVSFLEDTRDRAGVTARRRLVVPKAALRREADHDVVYVLREGRLERRAVSVGTVSGDEADVISGIVGGEQVVVEGPTALTDGARASAR